ncbi:CBS domain-containing protein [Gryllotalpicola kribbensis]|uniref:CBS domain-containing protein n=1 Tax=Gryllotalpicola kribbensis TaxID=993084 RepID=A0ABP8AL46_9MICO
MSAQRVFVARLAGCLVFDPVGDRVGKVRDVVVVYRGESAPRVVGLVVEIPGKRRVFVSITRVTSIGAGQVITTGLINVRRFEPRAGELRVIAEILGRQLAFRDGSGTATIEDVAITQTPSGQWDVTQLFVRRPKTSSSPFAKGATQFVAWSDMRETDASAAAPQSAEQLIATYTDLKPADLATSLLELPAERRVEVAAELPDERLADALEEMQEQDQVELLRALDDERVAAVLDQMQPDDAADLFAQLTSAEREHLLELMEPEEAEDVRRLLNYAPNSAGGLMTTEPVIMSADATVAEALALIRREELPPALAASVFLTLPPYEPPTGRFLGTVHYQRMLRHPPHERLGGLVDQGLEPVLVDATIAEVSRTLASYNLVAVPVVDEKGRLVGVVTIDDILDHLLPDDWRRRDGEDAALKRTAAARTGNIGIIGRR